MLLPLTDVPEVWQLILMSAPLEYDFLIGWLVPGPERQLRGSPVMG
jgi:hypothetical protein